MIDGERLDLVQQAALEVLKGHPICYGIDPNSPPHKNARPTLRIGCLTEDDAEQVERAVTSLLCRHDRNFIRTGISEQRMNDQHRKTVLAYEEGESAYRPLETLFAFMQQHGVDSPVGEIER